jgi:hypothetical protein
MPTRLWAWFVTAMFVLQAAVPLLAATAASQRGVSLVEICSAYGMRTVQADASASYDDSKPMPGGHAAALDCALTPLLTSVALASPVAPVLLHAPRPPLAASVGAVRPLPADASQRWLAARLHAPPLSV